MIQLIRGFKDILPDESALWQQIEAVARELFADFGFQEIRIPVMERTELFARSIGEETDIVQKEMYTFPGSKGELITLRPEATASIVRAYIQHKMYAKDPVQKLYMIGPMFRRERPQKGRYRQFYQIDAEVFGVSSPLIDVQLIFLLATLLRRLSVTDVLPHINSLGCPECRPVFKTALSKHLSGLKAQLCSDCIRRSTTNPLRVLDCKVPSCREALVDVPTITDYLCSDCKQDFKTVQASLTKLGLDYNVDKRLVRGLDYYNRTTFEIQTTALGAQNAIAGGGRYDGLVKALGGPDQPATGFAVGFDRLVEIVGTQQQALASKPDLYIAALDQASLSKAFEWQCALVLKGIKTEMDFETRSLKSQMKRAHKSGADHVLIIGEQEFAKGAAILRNMVTKQQDTIPFDTLVQQLQKLLKVLKC